jgi:excisionase family DNA binding protein
MREGDGDQRAGRRGTFLGANDIARLCDVDLKTIHNWVDRGVLPHFRTPGRHLRFRPEHVATFLRTWGYAVPASLRDAAPKRVAVIGPKKVERLAQQAIEGVGIELCALEHPYDALLTVALEPASAYVIDADALGRDALETFTSALHRAAPTATITVVGAADGDVLDGALGARRDLAALRTALVGAGIGAPDTAPGVPVRASDAG